MVSTNSSIMLSQVHKYIMCFPIYACRKGTLQSKISMNVIKQCPEQAISTICSAICQMSVRDSPNHPFLRYLRPGAMQMSEMVQTFSIWTEAMGTKTGGVSPGYTRNIFWKCFVLTTKTLWSGIISLRTTVRC